MTPVVILSLTLGNVTPLLLQNETLFRRALGNAELIVGVLVEAVVVVTRRAVSRNNVRRKLDEVRCSDLWWRRF